MYTETDGIVLRQVKAARGRRIILLFTQKYGKISAGTNITEGNSKGKSALIIRPFTYGRYDLYQGRDYYDLGSGDVKKSYYSFGEDLDKFISASYVLELTEKLLPEELPQPRLFSLLLNFLDALEKRKSSFDTLVLAYEVKMLDILGYMPKLGSCARCGKENARIFSIPDGGMICGECAEKMEISSKYMGNDTLIYEPDFDIVNVLDYFLKKPLGSFEKLALQSKTEEELKRILRKYILYHLDVGPLKSESMM